MSNVLRFAKITREDANRIRTDTRPVKDIMEEYGLTRQAIRNIQIGQAWYQTGDVLLDALQAKGRGKIQNGDNMVPKKVPQKRVKLEDYNKPVAIKQPGAGKWSCDTCNARGEGGQALLRHSAKSNHRVFTPLDGRYAHLIHSS